eukprot:4991090-Prymnesium_polylepis.1
MVKTARQGAYQSKPARRADGPLNNRLAEASTNSSSKLVIAAVVRTVMEHELVELQSWLHYHQAIGVTAFVLISHHCSDVQHF